MSESRCTRLLNNLINVKNRLELLLVLCRSQERPSWMNDDESSELYRFCGPYQSDIEELQNSIIHISKLIENFAHEINSSVDRNPLPNYPLCKNHWTMEKIENLIDDQDESMDNLQLDTLQLLRLQALAECLHPLDDERTRQKSRCSHDHTFKSSSSIEIPNETRQTINLLDFPVEILLHIFSNLSPCELISDVAPTCRHFARLIISRCCKHLNLSKLISVSDVPQILRHLSSLQSLTFVNWENDVSCLSWSIWFDVLARTAINIRKIRFHNVLICPILIGLIVEYFPHCLETIIFDGQQSKTYEKFDVILCLLGSPEIRLQRLTASYQTGITNFGISQLVSNLNVLKELNLVYVEAIQDETVKILCNKHKNHLEILKIDGAQLTDQSLDYIGECCDLRIVLIEFCNNLTGNNFSIFQKLSFLTELHLSKLNDIPSECFQHLFDRNHRFEHLIVLKLGECHTVDDVCIQAIIETCPKLKDFTCTWAYGVTDVGFTEIVRQCHHLENLSLIGCYLISGEYLTYVPHEYLKAIKQLNFEQCNHISDDILSDLFQRRKTISITNYYGSIVEDEDEDENEI